VPTSLWRPKTEPGPGEHRLNGIGQTLKPIHAGNEALLNPLSLTDQECPFFSGYLKMLEGESSSLLKIDVEGFETCVIGGAQAVLSNKSLHSVIMELNGSGLRYGFSEDAISNTMNDYGFSTYAYEPFSRELKPLDGMKNPCGNTLFVRNIDAVKEKVACSPKVTIGKVQL
jgi:hypothetical protein